MIIKTVKSSLPDTHVYLMSPVFPFQDSDVANPDVTSKSGPSHATSKVNPDDPDDADTLGKQLKRRITSLTFKLSGCVKYFRDESAWAIQNSHNCKFWIERKEFQPNCYHAFAVYAQEMSHNKSDNHKAHQIGWIRETDRLKFVDFIHDLEDINNLNVTYHSGICRKEQNIVELYISVSK